MEEEILKWRDEALKYANDYFDDVKDLTKAIWMRDALYVAYLRGVEKALGKRLL